MTKKQKRILIRIILAAVLTVIAAVLPIEGTVRLLVFLVPYFVIGYDVLWKAGRNILNGQVFDENFLMSIATIGAFFTGDYPEAAAVMLFYQIGELFQGIAVGKSRRSIAALMDIKPEFATVLREGAEKIVSPEEVQVGETITVRPGERIPLDGILLEGHTTINASALTGESQPRDVAAGESVISGTINLASPIQVRVTAAYVDSTVSRILELVESSAARKARTESFITRFARYYTPCVVLAAVLIALIPPLVSDQPFSEWIHRALIFLVVSCPCALVISVPLSFFGGIGGAGKRGILIKGANYLEALSKVSIVCLDKTGTLTAGNFAVTKIAPIGVTKTRLLQLAAHAESYSNHPIACSIIKAHAHACDQSRVSELVEEPGYGITCKLDGKELLCGSTRLLNRAGLTPEVDPDAVGTIVHVAYDGVYCGHLVISDAIKPDAGTAIADLKQLGIQKTVLLTGDVRRVAEDVGKRLSLDEVHSELLPAQKTELVETFLASKPKGSTLAFAGDGVNDAPVLMRADLGIAMGALGSDAAIEAADVVLMDDNPKKVAEAIKLAKRTMRIVRQNIVFSLAVKGLVLLHAALGHASMWLAVFADVGVSVIAILNAMRALNVEKLEEMDA